MTQPPQTPAQDSVGKIADLLPCPFCGSADSFVERGGFSSAYVFCNDCGGKGPECNPETQDDADREDDDPKLVSGQLAATRAWNRRALDASDKDRRDAERYRWLRDKATNELYVQENRVGSGLWYCHGKNLDEEIDRRIDAAREVTP